MLVQCDAINFKINDAYEIFFDIHALFSIYLICSESKQNS